MPVSFEVCRCDRRFPQRPYSAIHRHVAISHSVSLWWRFLQWYRGFQVLCISFTMAYSSFDYTYGSPCPLVHCFGADLFGASSSPSSCLGDMPAGASGGLPEPTLLSQLMSAVLHLQIQVTALADSIMVDRQQHAADRAAAAAERDAAIHEATLHRAAEREARAEELRCSLERIDALAQVQAQLITSVAVIKPASPWICPVCHEPLVAMRSFKGHIKRLYEYTNAEQPADSRQRKCSLKAHLQYHQALVSRSPGDSWVVGDSWVACARAFATELWRQVHNLTSSDDCPDFVGRKSGVAGFIEDVGAAPH